MRYPLSIIRDEEIPSARDPLFQHALDTVIWL